MLHSFSCYPERSHFSRRLFMRRQQFFIKKTIVLVYVLSNKEPIVWLFTLLKKGNSSLLVRKGHDITCFVKKNAMVNT